MVNLLEDARPKNRPDYEWKSGSVNIAGTDATTLITTDADFTNLFATVPRAHHITIETSGTAYFRINSATADKITVTATTPFESEDIVAEKLYCSTNGGAITVTVKLA